MEPYIASNIGFGLPPGRFFKVELTTKDGPSLYTKIGGAEFESEARDYAVRRYRANLDAKGGLRATRVTEINQHQAVLFDAPLPA